MINHTFVVCAYGTCEYLEQCVVSLLEQSVKSRIIMITSTPNESIRFISAKYNIPLYVNDGEKGITQDWNFALSKVSTKYATIAHQDDLYYPAYAQMVVQAMENSRNPIIAFTDYEEIHGEKTVRDSRLIRVKRILLFMLRIRSFQKSRFIRRRSLSLGCGICCPSVTYCIASIQQPLFRHHFMCCEDWEAWEKLSKQKGSFVYIPERLIAHRIHEGSVTTQTVNGTGRAEEDLEMYQKFWPDWAARLLVKQYSRAEDYNRM